MKVIESAGKTREEAIQNGLKELGVDMHDIEKIDVIDEGSKGFLGLGARPVRVKLTAEIVEETPRRSGNRKGREDRRGGRDDSRNERGDNRKGGGKGKSRGQQQEKQQREGDAQSGKQEGQRRKNKKKRSKGPRQDNRNEKGEGTSQNTQKQGNAHKATPVVDSNSKSVTDEASEALRRAENFENNVADEDKAEALPPNARPEEEIETITDEQGKEAAAMLGEILGLMELEGEVTFTRVADGSARIAIESEADGGILIGKRGVTLHAIQYLVNRMIVQNEASDNTERVVVDVGGYVDRRHNTLADMARTMARRAKESGRNVRLKPLSPQERRIIHLTLEPDPEVRTYSLGDSLFRSIVINPVGGRSGGSNRGRGSNKGGGSNRRGRNSRNRNANAASSRE